MIKSRCFITGSVFEGNYDDVIHEIDGYGSYLYPDGTLYRGYFKRGRFHGYGSIHLSPPYCFTIKGYFAYGQLKLLDEMIFSDGLRMRAPCIGTELFPEEWPYVTTHDRRFYNEYVEGLSPVGPVELSSNKKRKLSVDTYDIEEGIYMVETGFVKNIQAPFAKRRFIANNNEVDWICQFCRHGHKPGDPYRINLGLCEHIIESNFKQATRLGERTRRCGCKFKHDVSPLTCKELAKLCEQVKPEKSEDESTTQGEDESSFLSRRCSKHQYICNTHVMKRLEEEDSTDYFSAPWSVSSISQITLKNLKSIIEDVKEDCYIATNTLGMPKEGATPSKEKLLWRTSVFDTDTNHPGVSHKSF